MDLYERSEKYKKLMDTVIEEHEDLAWIQGMVSIDCLAADKQKKSDAGYVLGECIRVKDVYREYCPYDFLIVIYEKNCAGMTEEQLKILMYHELLHVDVGEKNGEPVYRIRPHSIQDFRTIIEQYGIDWDRPGGR